MSFIADKQTLDDLNILGKYKANSIFNLFNKVKTGGGEKLLEAMFQNPLTDVEEINKRSNTFRYFQDQEMTFPFSLDNFAQMERYMDDGGGENLFLTGIIVLKKQLMSLTVKDDQYQLMVSGIQSTVKILKTCCQFINSMPGIDHACPHLEQMQKVRGIMADSRFVEVIQAQDGKLSFLKVIGYHYLFKCVLKEEIDMIVDLINHIDVYIAVSQLAKSKSFSYAQALPKEKKLFTATELCHPGLENGVANPVNFHQDSNLIFLTGANMAGKSTLMKTFGISVYLAHMGFPLAAKDMMFSIKDGIYSSINVPDNLNLGYSHFYAEVLRVKKVAEEVAEGKDLIVIFDELFKGTNVKDAYDATLAVTSAFSEYRNCLFIISTHIIEVGDELIKKHGHLQFLYLPTLLEGNVPRYTYKLQKGITMDRQGMMIIENEGILEILRNS